MNYELGVKELFETLSNSGFLKATIVDGWRACVIRETPPTFGGENFEKAGYTIWDYARWHAPNGEIKREEILQPRGFALLVLFLEILEFPPRNWAKIGLAFLSYQTNQELTGGK